MPRINNSKRKKKLTELAYNEIKKAIILNHVQVGDLLSTNDIAKELDISRTPVREAVTLLEKEGFVETKTGIGVIVKGISVKELSDIFEVRIALELACLNKSISKIPESEINNLITEWEECKAKFNTSDFNFDDIYELDAKTHDLNLQYCDNTYLKDILQGIIIKIRRIQNMSVRALGDPLETIDQHIKILESIKQGNLSEATKQLRYHITNAGLYIVDENISQGNI